MKLFVVLGMHRSGTSVVSRMLSLLGASLGPEGDLMAPKPDNPTGFWESRTVTQLHDDLLAELGGRWNAPAFPAPGWESTPRIEPFRERIARLVASHFSGEGVAVWKDPRGSLLLSLWKAVTPIHGAIVVTREPAEVVSSLARRDPITPSRAVRLTLRYTAEAYRQTPEPLVVAHDDLFTAPERVARRLASHCELPEPTSAALAAIGSFVDPRRRRADRVELDDPLLCVASGLHRALVESSPAVVRSFADLACEHLRMGAEVEFVRDRLSRFVPR